MASTSRLGPVLRFPLASHCICTCMHPSPTYPTTARKYSLSLNVPLPGKWKACKNRPLQQSDLTQRRHSSRSTSRPNGKANKRIKTTMQKIVQIQPVRAIDQSAPSAERKTLVTMGEMLDDMGLIPGKPHMELRSKCYAPSCSMLIRDTYHAKVFGAKDITNSGTGAEGDRSPEEKIQRPFQVCTCSCVRCKIPARRGLFHLT